MQRIAYWQCDMRLVPANPQTRTLPQDEATAAVVIAAILARNLESGSWPGEYWASVDSGGADPPAVVAEDDPRVAVARATLTDMLPAEPYDRRRDFTTRE